MATKAPRRVSRTRRTAAADNRHVRVQARWVDIHSIRPYDFNPRDNAAAVDSVANSIKTYGFIVPVVITRAGVLAAGHTRVEAAKKLGMSEVYAISAEHLTEEQIMAFRLIDNKVAELAKWDFDLLAGEIQKLQGTGIDLTDYGWQREELDCLTDVVRDDCLSGENLIDAESQERMRRADRRAPAQARFVLGELVFFISAEQYRTWIDGLRARHDFNEQQMVADVKQRLGIHT
jgi:hypothetical protein